MLDVLNLLERRQATKEETITRKALKKKWSKEKEKNKYYISKECVIHEESTSDEEDDKDKLSFVTIIEERVKRELITSTSIHKNWITEKFITPYVW